jgi:hypothetical protein
MLLLGALLGWIRANERIMNIKAKISVIGNSGTDGAAVDAGVVVGVFMGAVVAGVCEGVEVVVGVDEVVGVGVGEIVDADDASK